LIHLLLNKNYLFKRRKRNQLIKVKEITVTKLKEEEVFKIYLFKTRKRNKLIKVKEIIVTKLKE